MVRIVNREWRWIRLASTAENTGEAAGAPGALRKTAGVKPLPM
jgi:hypothetical protein